MKKHILTIPLLVLALLAGCTKEPTPPAPPLSHWFPDSPAYLLSEGSWGGNDANLSLMDCNSDTIIPNWFSDNNGRGIGDLAQDLIHYGNRLYAAVFTSNTIEVIDPLSGKSVKQIDMGQRGPRYLAAHQGKIYVSCYDKTIVRIDTLSLNIEASCPLSGMQPEQLCILGNNLYVCNCWQYGSNGNAVYDSTLSIVDLGSFSETGKIPVGLNPGKIKVLDSHRLLVACAGDYKTHAATTLVVDLVNGQQTPLPVAATNFDIFHNTVYLYCTSYNTQGQTSSQFFQVDANTLQSTPILQNHSLPNAYSININPANGNIYVCNSPYNANADIYTFLPDGTQIHHVEGSILSSKVVF